MAETRQFQRWGWVIAAAAAVFDAIMVNDTFLLRPGEHGVLATWVHFPVPWALGLAVPLAHLWLLVVVALRGLERLQRERGRAEVSRGLVAVLFFTVGVFHAIFWDNGRWVNQLLSVVR